MLINYEHHSTFTITRFRDGDTVEGFYQCRACGSARREVIRLLRIDSWEPKSPDGHRATETAKRLTSQFRGITCLVTTKSIRRDRYGRMLTDLTYQDKSIAATIVEMGLAWYGVGEPQPGPYS